MTAVKKTVSLSELDVSSKCASGYTFDYLDSDGNKTGIKLTVLGAHAPSVQDWLNKELNARRRQEAMQMKQGKPVIRDIEGDIKFGAEYMAVRLIGWEGITEPYSQENALTLCLGNPSVQDQIKTASDNLANFTKSK